MSTKKRNKARRHKRSRRAKILIGLVALVLAITLAIGATGFMFVASAAQDIPSLENSKKYFSTSQTSKIYDADGNLLTALYIEQNRETVPLDKISPHLQNAVISIEDRRFYEHKGVDWKAIARALASDVEAGRIVEGGSTLTQQLVKNTIVTNEKTFKRKIQEAALAYEVEKRYDKKQILELYLNTIFFGQSAYGAETASRMFFDKDAASLTLAESALLAGIIRSPNTYSPYVNLEAAKARRDLVLKDMLKAKLISKVEADQAIASPIQVRPLASKNVRFPYFVDMVKRTILDDKRFGATPSQRANALYSGGLRIYTTIDPRMQDIAEQAAWTTLDRPGDPAVAIAAVEPKTGHIKAMVGGKDYNSQKFDLASQGLRQPGSAFKPFVLAAALENGVSATKTYDSTPGIFRTSAGSWNVNNSEGRGSGMLDLATATRHSVNAVFARLILDVGADKVADMAHKLGIVSYVEPFPAIALGGLGKGVSPLDMAAAYSTLANMGERVKPMAITKVVDGSGNILVDNQPKPERVISPASAYLVTNMMEGVIHGGTGSAANIGKPAAGKTGTTEENGDAWFVGYTPDMAAAVWVGYPGSRASMTNVHGRTVFGGTFPAEIWRKFMSQALAGRPGTPFQRPAGISGIRICKDMKGFLANEFCPPDETDYLQFAKGSKVPKNLCDRHKAPNNVKVPNLVGLTAAQARQALQDAGLKGAEQSAYSPRAAKGEVISQDPGSDAEVAKDSTVTYTVSSGRDPNQVVVPNLVGMTAEQVRAALARVGLIGTSRAERTNDPRMVGKVLRQSPREATILNRNSEVTVWMGVAR